MEYPEYQWWLGRTELAILSSDSDRKFHLTTGCYWRYLHSAYGGAVEISDSVIFTITTFGKLQKKWELIDEAVRQGCQRKRIKISSDITAFVGTHGIPIDETKGVCFEQSGEVNIGLMDLGESAALKLGQWMPTI